MNFIILVTSEGNLFSGPKEDTPSMHNMLKHCIKIYKESMKIECKIRRCGITKQGIKTK